jgi:hypothetical protein
MRLHQLQFFRSLNRISRNHRLSALSRNWRRLIIIAQLFWIPFLLSRIRLSDLCPFRINSNFRNYESYTQSIDSLDKLASSTRQNKRNADICASRGIRTHDRSIWEADNILYLWPLDHSQLASRSNFWDRSGTQEGERPPWEAGTRELERKRPRGLSSWIVNCKQTVYCVCNSDRL